MMHEEIESQFSEHKPAASLQDLNVDLTADERAAAIKGLRKVRELIASDEEMIQGIVALLLAVTRSYETSLHLPRLTTSLQQRSDEDTYIRGLRFGLAEARDYLTDPRYGVRLLSIPEPEKED